MYTKYLKSTCSPESMRRFRFRVIVTCYYEIKFKSHWEKIVLDDVEMFQGTMGIEEGRLRKCLKSAFPNHPEETISQIIENFRDDSTAVDSEYITIIPDFILQSTGKPSVTQYLIYEGDIVKDAVTGVSYAVVWDDDNCMFILQNMQNPSCKVTFNETSHALRIIGNVYQDLGSVK